MQRTVNGDHEPTAVGPLPPAELADMRREIDGLSTALIRALEDRARAAITISEYKRRAGLPLRDRTREKALIDRFVQRGSEVLDAAALERVLTTVIDACVAAAGIEDTEPLRVDARSGPLVDVTVRGHRIGRGSAAYIAGPCSIEDETQIECVAAGLARQGVGFLRGGAFKPRTSPYSFQGLGEFGLELLGAAARRHGMATISEATSPTNVETVARHVDVIQIGARNMANYELLRAAGRTGQPVVLKRGFGATLEEWLGAAEYLASAGTDEIILCERGIRTFSHDTRDTLDLSSVPLMLMRSRLPVIVDVSHAAGRRDILAPLASAAFAAGAEAVMVEVHPDPRRALSDAKQQLDLVGFAALQSEVATRLSGLAAALGNTATLSPDESLSPSPARIGGPKCA
jgi:3-deoxy-7-phosphoheptulonate synthase/chorismate mutase